jgi:hypothetical protein
MKSSEQKSLSNFPVKNFLLTYDSVQGSVLILILTYFLEFVVKAIVFVVSKNAVEKADNKFVVASFM